MYMYYVLVVMNTWT